MIKSDCASTSSYGYHVAKTTKISIPPVIHCHSGVMSLGGLSQHQFFLLCSDERSCRARHRYREVRAHAEGKRKRCKTFSNFFHAVVAAAGFEPLNLRLHLDCSNIRATTDAKYGKTICSFSRLFFLSGSDPTTGFILHIYFCKLVRFGAPQK